MRLPYFVRLRKQGWYGNFTKTGIFPCSGNVDAWTFSCESIFLQNWVFGVIWMPIGIWIPMTALQTNLRMPRNVEKIPGIWEYSTNQMRFKSVLSSSNYNQTYSSWYETFAFLKRTVFYFPFLRLAMTEICVPFFRELKVMLGLALVCF